MSGTTPTSEQVRIDTTAANLRRDFTTLYPALPASLPDILSKEMHRSFAAVNILHDLPGKAIEDEFGQYINREGTQFQDQVINDCIEAYTEQGNPVMIGAGLYACGRPLQLIDDSVVRASKKADFRKKFGTYALLTQADFGTPISNISWMGGIISHEDPTNQSSNPFSLNIIDSEVAFLKITKWGDIGRLLLFGDNNQIHHIYAINQDTDGVGQGGGIWTGRATGNLVEFVVMLTGDDGLMWNLAAQGNYTGGLCAGNVYSCCVVRSTNARGLVTAMQRIQTPPLPDIDGTIRDNVASKIVVYASSGFGAYNTLGTGPMHGMSLSQCFFDCSEYDGTIAAIDINADSLHGGLYDFDLDRVVVKGPYERALHVRGVAADIRVRRSTLDAPRTTQNTVEIDEMAEVYIDSSTIVGRSDADLMQVGADGNADAKAYVTGTQFQEIADAHDGLVVTSSAGGSLDECTFLQASGATSARAAAVLTDAHNFRVGANDYSDIALAAKVLWTPADNQGCVISAANIVTTASNTTTVTALSGTTYVFTAAGSRTLTLPAAYAGVEFILVQEGAGAAVLRAAGSDTIRQPGSVSSAGGTLTSGAQGNFVHVKSIQGKWVVVAIGGTWTAA